MSDPAPDDWIARLARLFAEHPAWRSAARHLSADASSMVFFTTHPGRAWRLEQRTGVPRLVPGRDPDPDFVFRFTPHSVERLEATRGGVGDFAVELFTLMTETDPEVQVRLRIVAGMGRLMRRGYVRLLLAAGPRVLEFGATHGIRTLGALRRFVADLRSRVPAPWESEAD